MHRSFSRTIELIAATPVAAAMLLIGQAHAQSEATASADGSVTILAPITLTKETDLKFGSIAKGSTGSNTVTINHTTGAIGIAGGGNGSLISSDTSNATYTVAGEEDESFSIDVDENVTLTSGSDSIIVSLASAASTGTLTNGEATFGVGGSFVVDSATNSGNYTGSFDVTVAYN